MLKKDVRYRCKTLKEANSFFEECKEMNIHDLYYDVEIHKQYYGSNTYYIIERNNSITFGTIQYLDSGSYIDYDQHRELDQNIEDIFDTLRLFLNDGSIKLKDLYDFIKYAVNKED